MRKSKTFICLLTKIKVKILKNTNTPLTATLFTLLFLCMSICAIGQANGIAYTAEHTGTFNDFYNHEVDAAGNVI